MAKKKAEGELVPVGVVLPAGYAALLEDLKGRIQAARTRALLAVNHELILLYWQMGREILRRQAAEGWGTKVIERLAADLGHAFPGVGGLSPRNLKYMRALAEAYPEETFVQQAVARIPWGHNVIVVEKIKDHPGRAFYLTKAAEHGWSRAVLAAQIDGRLHERQGKAVSNFDRALPPADSDLARQLLKDPYHFDFLTLAEDARERDLERGLIAHLKRFMLELGVGFAFVGSQVPLEVGGQDFAVDLLFYHCKLHCYFVIDLKMEEFVPEHAGKMNFYLSAVDDLMRDGEVDRPTLGLILCRRRNKVVAEYALRDVGKPIGVAGFETRLVESLPRELAGALPSVAMVEEEIGRLGGCADGA